MKIDVERRFSYIISWSTHNDAGEGADYGIRIISYDGHGIHREAFNSAGYAFGSYPVDIDID